MTPIIIKVNDTVTIPIEASNLPCEIVFNGRKYTLTITKNGKLILT